MPRYNNAPPKYKQNKSVTREWKDFRKGLNVLLRETELGNDEYSVGDNIMLEGAGVPTGRWGTQKYFTANATGTIRGFALYNSRNSDGTYDREILALSDQGYLAKKDGTGSSVVTGQSWPSGSIIQSEQLGGKAYVVSRDVPFTEYNGTNLVPYTTVPAPTGLSATNISGVTGSNVVSYVVAAVGPTGGSTEGSTNYVLSNVPFDISKTQIDLQWTGSSATSLSGYEIYRGTAGDERLLDSVGPAITNYSDSIQSTSPIIQAPIINTTGGVKSNLLIKYKDRLVTVDVADPTKLMVSGRYPYHTSFSWIHGGGYDYIDPDGGESITGLAVQPISDNIVVYKDHASYLVNLALTSIGVAEVLEVQYQPISTSIGCSNQETLQAVENDVFYFGKDGLYVTGYEPNFLNIIRTNEVSAKMRPYLDTISDDDVKNACSGYFNNRYIISFPGKREMLVYDRERGAFAGVWKLPYGISHIQKYYDATGTEKWVLGSAENNQVYTFEKSVNSDDGTLIYKKFRTNKEDFGDWTLLTIIRFFYIMFGTITGTTTVNLIVEDRAGLTKNAKTFTISGAEVAGISGFGYGKYGEYPYGVTNNAYSASTNEIKRWATVFKQAALVQVEVTSTANNSNFELIAIKMSADKQAEGSLNSAQRV
jgi:hypothetical protein